MIGLELVYFTVGLLLFAAGLYLALVSRPKRVVAGIFWVICGVCTGLAEQIPDSLLGLLFILLLLFSCVPQDHFVRNVRRDSFRTPLRARSSLLYGVIILIPIGILGTVLLSDHIRPYGAAIFRPGAASLFGFFVGCFFATLATMYWTGSWPFRLVAEGSEILYRIGFTAILPQALAVLGSIFVDAGVSDLLPRYLSPFVPFHNTFLAVGFYCLSMALLTLIMGNAFAAFPILAGSIGFPILSLQHNVPAAAVAAIGMLSGYCGTLMSPLAANFNVLPAKLFGIERSGLIILMQAPTAIAVLFFNIFLLYILAA